MADGDCPPDPGTARTSAVTASRGPEEIVVIAGIGLVSILAWWSYRAWDFDDAYIVYRIAENILDGDGWTYNPGERYNASTSVLNTVAIVVVAAVVRSAPVAAHLVGTAALFASGLITYRLLRGDGGVLMASAASVGLIAMMADNRTWGLEINLFVSLVLLFVWAEHQGRNTWPLVGLIFLARPDGIIVVATKLVVETHRERRVPVRGPLLALAVVVPWLFFSLVYFGQLAPTTLSQKVWQGRSGFWGTGYIYLDGLISHLAGAGLWLLPIAVLAIAGVTDCVRRRSPMLHLFAFVALQQLCYVILDVPPYHWYFATLDVGLFLAVAVGLVWSIGLIGSHAPWAERPLGGIVLVAVLVASAQMYRPLLSDRLLDDRDLAYREISDAIDRSEVGEGALAAVEVGTLGYRQDRTIVDLLSLTSENPEFVSGRNNDEFFRIAPKIVVAFSPVQAMERAIFFDPRFEQLYEFADAAGGLQFHVRTTDDEREIGAVTNSTALTAAPFEGVSPDTDCWIQTANSAEVRRGERLVVDAGGGVSVTGWMVDAGSDEQGARRLALVDRDGATIHSTTTTALERPDVADAFGNPSYLMSGFSAHLSTSGLAPGVYDLAVLHEVTSHLCPADVTLAVEN